MKLIQYFTYPPPPPPFHWTAIPLRSWRNRIFSKIIPNRRGSVDNHTIWGLDTSSTLPLRFCYDPTTTMKMQLRLVYADGDAAATLPRPRRWSYAFDALLYLFHLKSEVHMIYVPLKVNDRRDQVALLQLAIMNLDDRRSRQDGVGGPKGPGTSMINRRQTAIMWALWPLILIRAMSMEGGYSFFN